MKPYPDAGPSAGLGSSAAPMQTPPAGASYSGPSPSSTNGAFLDDLNPENLPPDLKKEGSDWFAIFNPKLKRVLDVNLMQTLSHER